MKNKVIAFASAFRYVQAASQEMSYIEAQYCYRYQPSQSSHRPINHPPSSKLLINKQPRHPLPRPNTHTRKQHPLLLPPTLTQPRTDLPRPRRPKRMSQRNGAAPDIHLRGIDAQVIDAVDGHRGEGFVELDDVDIRG